MNSSATEVPYGTFDLMMLSVLPGIGPLHGYGLGRRIEQVAEGALALNQGTVCPALLRLEQKVGSEAPGAAVRTTAGRPMRPHGPPKPLEAETENGRAR